MKRAVLENGKAPSHIIQVTSPSFSTKPSKANCNALALDEIAIVESKK